MASEPQVKLFDFSEKVAEKTVYFKVMTLEKSFFIWIGSSPQLANMAVAMPPIYEGTPSASTILGNKTEEMSSSLALKLAKKYKQQVFVSCSVPFDPQQSLIIEKRLAEELKKILGS